MTNPLVILLGLSVVWKKKLFFLVFLTDKNYTTLLLITWSWGQGGIGFIGTLILYVLGGIVKMKIE